MLQTLAGPVPVEAGLRIALHALREGLDADEVALIAASGEVTTCRGYSSAAGDVTAADATRAASCPSSASPAPRGRRRRRCPRRWSTRPAAALDRSDPDGVAVAGVPWLPRARERCAPGAASLRTGSPGTVVPPAHGPGSQYLSVSFASPDGRTVLLAGWRDGARSDDATDLLEDAANSLRLALERERALLAQQEAMALRQSRELQRTFLRRLSHELRTPLTAITGYATSLLQQDVTWDADSQQRFLSRIAAESARLGRLVNDLLDFSTIESGILRLNSDWCDIPLVLDAAVAVLPREAASAGRGSSRRPGCRPSGPTMTGLSRCSST